MSAETEARRLTDEGREALLVALSDARIGQGDVGAVIGVSNDKSLSTPVGRLAVPTTCTYGNRLEMAADLQRRISAAGLEGDASNDRDLWGWLASLWAEALIIEKRDGSLQVAEDACWVPALEDWKKFYRHLLAAPVWVYANHQQEPELLRCIMDNPVHTRGEMWEQVASHKELIRNAAALRLVNRLYWDEDADRRKPGSSSKDRGSIRRLAVLLQQLDLTYDIYGLSLEEFEELLPREYERFLS